MRCFSLLICLYLLVAAPAWATPVAVPAAPQQVATRPAAPAYGQASAINGVTRLAADAGVRTCLQNIEQTGSFITANTQSKALPFLPPADTDRQLTSFSYEVELPNRAVAYASLSAAPTTAGGCDTLYETVAYWNTHCEDVAARGFPEARRVGVLQQQIIVLQGGPQLRVFLMPAGPQGCVAIKKEVSY